MEKLLRDEHMTALNGLFPERNINIGWASGGDFISSKIYGDGKKKAEVLTTEVLKVGEGIRITHQIEDYK